MRRLIQASLDINAGLYELRREDALVIRGERKGTEGDSDYMSILQAMAIPTPGITLTETSSAIIWICALEQSGP